MTAEIDLPFAEVALPFADQLEFKPIIASCSFLGQSVYLRKAVGQV